MTKYLLATSALAVVLLGAGCSSNAGEQARLDDLIWVDVPRIEADVTSPLTVTGQARGTWFFEATFPVKLVGEDGNVILQTYATATDEWMTEDYVPFTSTLTFDVDPQEATLVLEKDNPSGLPANDASLEIPVTIK